LLAADGLRRRAARPILRARRNPRRSLMLLEGSCHCAAVRFRLRTRHPYPFNLCYCSICRKTTGGGGFAINLGGEHASLAVEGREHLRVYRAKLRDAAGAVVGESEAERHFCGLCGSHLWLWDPRWPELVHPLAAAIDTALPAPPERTHLMLASKASWVEPAIGPRDQRFDEYPDEAISAWHERLGLVSEGP
jgi:hypothetical protein